MTMPMRQIRLGLVIATLGLAPLLAFGASAQDTPATPGAEAQSPSPDEHPVTINPGTCDQPVARPAFLAGGTTPWGLVETGIPDLTGAPLLMAEATLQTTLDDLLHAGRPHVILVHQSAEQFGTHLACGDIAGAIADGQLAIALRPVGDSGVAGVAILDRDERGFLGLGEQEVRTTVYVVTDLGDRPVGPTAATPAIGGVDQPATPTAAPTVVLTTPSLVATPAVSGPAQTEVTVEMVDVAFRPTQITVPANTPVTVTLHNTGVLLHNFSIDELRISRDVQPGQTATVTIDAPAGTYQYYCDQPGHREAGMVGALTVT